MPPSLLQGLELVEESDRIQCSVHGGQPTLIRGVEYTTGQHERRMRCRVPCNNARHSVHVVALSVKVNVYRNDPSVLPPQWALENPGLTSAVLGYADKRTECARSAICNAGGPAICCGWRNCRAQSLLFGR